MTNLSASWPLARTKVMLDEVDSTSNYAKEWLIADFERTALPFVVRARRQKRGRGQDNREWWSDEGSLSLTIALDPAQHSLTPPQESRLALIGAIAVIDALRKLLPDEIPLGIRWPNDVESNNRKLCGILPERLETLEGPRDLVGIGINIRTQLQKAPVEVQELAVSVEQLRNAPIADEEFEQVFRDTLSGFEQLLVPLANEDARLAQRWDQLSTLRGRDVRVRQHNRVLKGVALGIDSTGALSLACPDGIQAIVGGQVFR